LSSWNEVDLSKVSITIEPLAVGEYTFQLLPGAKRGANDPERIELKAAVAEGEFAGRHVYFSYPSPSYDWVPRVMKRLVVALGVDAQENEHPVEYFNRVAGELGGAAKFAAPIKEGRVSPEYPTPRRELDIFKVRAAA
jgi:hypothetical protein